MSAQPAVTEPSLLRLLAIVTVAIVAAAFCASELVRAGESGEHRFGTPGERGACGEAAGPDGDGPCALDPRALSGRPCSAQRSS